MKLDTQYSALPQMNAESTKRDKTLEKIAAAQQLNMSDSASQAIASMMQSDISGMSQGLSNVNDGISMMQIADGTLNGLSQQTQTLNDLSVRYNSASLNESQKQGLQSEFNKTVDSMQQSINTTTYNGQSLFNTTNTFSLGDGSTSVTLGNVSPNGLSIDNQAGISDYAKTLSSVSSDIGSANNGFISASNTLLSKITETSAAKSQIADTDLAKAISDFQQSNSKLNMAQIAIAHQNDALRQTIGRLLG
ncbi:flagellin [Sulfuricurvum sp.]|uniref:flagellin n=1 Tax=Sulfuricurvum sp. TaxID=2025608 RepID=UPI003563A4F9